MRKLLPLFLTLIAVPLFAFGNDDASNGRSQSYFTFDDGGTIVRQGDDGKEVEARVNFPIYAGDEITTSRRGRSEIRLSDGNVIALDRGTQIRFGGIRDSYDNDGNSQTIIELHYGHVMLERDSDDREPVRLDTPNASFAATERAIYSVDTSSDRGAVRVYDGTIEVRTPSRTTRVHAGEEGRLDDQGLYDLVNLPRGGADDFERWFLGRSEIYRGSHSRYLDRSLAYADPDLDRYGSWVYASDYGAWCWRPVILSVGWRPYFNGYWHHGRGGALVWVSYDPWGWVPYHYGRWAFDPGYGWVWLPGYAYSPAWVYWMYGPGYVGWAPAGWYDCYRPYYGWAYRPYARAGFGFGFYGRVRLHDVDLRPWTFVEPGHFVGSRIDHVALRNEVIRERFGRGDGGYATVSGAAARFSRAELRDPAAAINNFARRGRDGSNMHAADMTPFFRRDATLATAVRDHIVRSRVAEPGFSTPRGVGAGVPTPGTGGTLEGRVPRDGGGSRHVETPPNGGIERGVGAGTVGDWRSRDRAAGTVGSGTATRNRDTVGTVRRGDTPSTPERGRVTPRDNTPRDNTPRDNTPRDNTPRDNAPRGNWRDRVDRPSTEPRQPSTSTSPAPRSQREDVINRDTWRGRGNDGYSRGSVRESAPRDSGRSDVPRRIIDSVGGARIYSGERPSRSSGGSGNNSGGSSRGNSGGSSRGSSPPPSRSSGGEHSSSGSSHSSGSGGGGEHHKH